MNENQPHDGKKKLPAAIYGNPLTGSQIKKIARWQLHYIRKFNYDPHERYVLALTENKLLGPLFGVKNIIRTEQQSELIDPHNAVLCATVRAGFGPHRAAIAVASCAHELGLQPYWLDVRSIPGLPGDLMDWIWTTEYGRLSNLSQRSKWFDKYVWETITSGQPTLPWLARALNSRISTWSWKQLKTNARDASVSILMKGLFEAFPSDLPVITTISWNAQAAVAGGMKNVINLILDNWPLAFWLAEGALQCVQTPSAYYGYRTLTGFLDDDKIPQPISADSIHNVGHIIDHELVSNIEIDCEDRLARATSGEPRRFLISMGGAGAQRELFEAVIKHLAPHIEAHRATLFVNLGDHQQHLEWLIQHVTPYNHLIKIHSSWEETVEFATSGRAFSVTGIHFFLYSEILQAVYATNYLMRISDVLITKPSELAFYPIPKILNRRVGGHEIGGAIRCAELGEGTPETLNVPQTLNAIDLLIKEKNLLELFCKSIVDNKRIGIYDGGYNAVKMIIKERSVKSDAFSR